MGAVARNVSSATACLTLIAMIPFASSTRMYCYGTHDTLLPPRFLAFLFARLHFHGLVRANARYCLLRMPQRL